VGIKNKIERKQFSNFLLFLKESGASGMKIKRKN
jgi:hypothetical protein